jgi:hypothetical protein
MKMPRMRLMDDTMRVGHLSITFQRTLRIPDDGRRYPLPPGLGRFPVRRVKDFESSVPATWRERGGYFIPMYQREALWISFAGEYWRPNAVKVGVGGVNAVSGQPFDDRLRRKPQDYLVVPDQPWLDGINAGPNLIRQFVAMPLGQGFTVERQVTGEEKEGGIQLTVIEPKPGRFPAKPPRIDGYGVPGLTVLCEASTSFEMGLGAGGQMEQKIYPDEYGPGTWDLKRRSTVRVHIVNSEMYHAITGEAPPPTPISARTYTEYGLPWFELYDEHCRDVAAPEVLKRAKSVAKLEKKKRVEGDSMTDSLFVKKSQTKRVAAKVSAGPDGPI